MAKPQLRLQFRPAQQDDNASILELINSLPMAGEFEVLLKKEPDYFTAAKILGDTVQTVVGICNNKVRAIGTRSLKQVYINSKQETLGYLSGLRISNDARKMRALTDGYAFMKNLMDDASAKLHITTIIEDNRSAKAALTWKNKSSAIPNYFDLGLFYTYLIIPILPKFCRGDIKITKGSIGILDKIVEFLNQTGKNKQFFPVYTTQYFLSLPNFNIEDFYVALNGDEIIGVLAKWCQMDFKQIVVSKYNNKWLKLFSGVLLPKENESIKQFFASFIAIKNNNPLIFEQLLARLYNENRDYRYFELGLHEKDELNQIMKRFLRIKYTSRLFAAEYKTDEEISGTMEVDRTPYLELATL